MNNRVFFAGIVVFVAQALSGCGGSDAQPQLGPYTPRFTFEPADAKAAAGAGITMAVVRPAWKVADTKPIPKPQGGPDITKTFATALSSDLEKLLIHRGISVAGPYDSLEEMTFPQKKQADLVLTPQISVEVVHPPIQAQMAMAGNMWSGYSPSAVYVANGMCSATGFIAFQVIEPLSGQKVWMKKVEVAAAEQECSAKGTQNEVLLKLSNGVAQVLESVYPAIMKKAAAYFVREEMDLVKKQSQDLRDKKVY